MNSMATQVSMTGGTTDILMSAVAAGGTPVSTPVPATGPQPTAVASAVLGAVQPAAQSAAPMMVQQVPAAAMTSGKTGAKMASSAANVAPAGAAGGMCDEKTVEYLRDLIEEKKTIEINCSGKDDITKSIVLRLLDQGKQQSIPIQVKQD